MEIPIPQWVVDLFVWFGTLFTKQEWRAISLMIFVTIASTQTAKIIWRRLPVKGPNNGSAINFIASALGFVFSFPLWPATSVSTPWWVVGFIIGPLAVFIFKFANAALKTFFPKLAAFMNADRRKNQLPVLPADIAQERRQS